MAAFSSRRTRNAVRHGALGLALALPLVVGLPTQAQSEAAETERDEAQLEDVQVNALEDGLSDEPGAQEPIEVVRLPLPVLAELVEDEQPRVLITDWRGHRWSPRAGAS